MQHSVSIEKCFNAIKKKIHIEKKFNNSTIQQFNNSTIYQFNNFFNSTIQEIQQFYQYRRKT